MNIRTRLRVTVFLTVASAIVVAAVVLAANDRVNAERAQGEKIRVISETLLLLDSLTVEYLTRPETRVAVQWKAGRDEIGKQLRSLAPATPEGKVAVRLMLNDYERTQFLYDRLTALGAEGGTAAGREVLAGQLRLKIRSLVSGAFRLETETRNRVFAIREQSLYIVAALFAALVAVIAGSSFLFGRSILIPLNALRKGMEIVGAGNLEHRVGLETHDEIGDLSRAFDRMSENLGQVELTLRRLNRELRAISNCNEALMRAVNEHTLLDDICRIVCDEAGYRMVCVAYAENDAAKTIRPVAWAGVEEGYLERARLTWADTERGRGPGGTAIRTGQSAYIQDFAADPHVEPWRASALQRGYRSVIALPLKDESENTFGVLLIYATTPNAFSPEEIRLLEELAGDLAFGIVVLRNRIERKRADEEIIKLNHELLSRLEALEQAKKEVETISYTVSHDMKVPLRAIDGFASIMRDEYKSQLGGEGERYLEVVRGNIARMGQLIEGLLDFISLSQRKMRMTDVDMGALAREVFAELRAAVPEREIHLRAGDFPPARCDPNMIRGVLVNLLGNAIKFTGQRTEALIEIGGAATDNENAYFVRDNGVGFDMRYMDKLFGVGLKLHSPDEYDGAGIGLAIVKRIILRHGGRISAESKVGEGATFHFTLPVAEVE